MNKLNRLALTVVLAMGLPFAALAQSTSTGTPGVDPMDPPTMPIPNNTVVEGDTSGDFPWGLLGLLGLAGLAGRSRRSHTGDVQSTIHQQ